MKSTEEIRIAIANVEQEFFYGRAAQALDMVENLLKSTVAPLFVEWQRGIEPEPALQPLILRLYLLKSLALMKEDNGKVSEQILEKISPFIEKLPVPNSREHAYLRALEKGIKGTISAMRAEYSEALVSLGESVALIRKHSLASLKCRFLGNLAMLHQRLGNQQLAQATFAEAIAHARRTDDKPELCRLLINLGAAYETWENEPEAYLCLQEALPIAKQLQHDHYITLCASNLSSILYDLGRKDQAYPYLKEAEEVAAKTDNFYVLCLVESLLGTIYADEGRVAEGLEAHLRALQYAEKIQHSELIYREYGMIANRYVELEEFDRALEYYLQALDWAERCGQVDALIHIKSNLSNLLNVMGKQEEAFVQAQEARDIAAKHETWGHYSLTFSRLALITADKEFSGYNIEQAHNYIEKALACEDTCKPYIYLKILKKACVFYEKIGDWKKSYHYWQKFYRLKESIAGEAERRYLLMYEKEREAILLRREKELLSLHNKQLKEANDLKTRLLGIAAHDLKNPLASIQGIAKILLHSVDDENKKLVQLILDSSSDMKQLVSDLLNSTVASTGNLTLKKSLASLDSIIDIAMSRSYQQAKTKKQTLHSETSPECVLYIDQNKIIQVLDNIIANAIKYSPLNSEIYVKAVLHDDTVTISIADQGQGLSPEDLTKMFGQFQKLSSTPTAGESSTGLGLYIVKQIVELHGGSVWAESPGKGQGSTFFVRLPAAIPDEIRQEFLDTPIAN